MKLRSLLTTIVTTGLLGTTFVVGFAPVAAGAATRPAHKPRVVRLAQPITARAVAGAAIPVSSAPRASSPTTLLPPTTEFGTTTVLLATARKGSWYRVSLPTRPNGSTGWLRARHVELRAVRDAIHVDLAARTLTWSRDSRVVLTTPVAVGAPDTPTPTGSFFLTDLLDNADDTGPYGPFALGVSAHSDTLSEFAGGDGQIGIHGTDAPGSIGQSVSHGCVRVPNDVVTQLAQGLPLGTPVTIV
jgi:lipoprotein-anchoring transpeptidase ErfK/SrfK